jgi:tRNA pseudouridine55 synthase
MVFKMGHGGTLDPLATGVLIIGLGRGTKALPDFLGGTKTYETVVLFGKATDTYDVAGKIVTEKPHGHITRSLVEDKIKAFRGHIKQVPPIYSALKINGMKAYDYARSGKPLPRELESRDMVVDECEIMDWYEGGQHDFRWPAAAASAEDKAVARKLLKIEEATVIPPASADSVLDPPETTSNEGSRQDGAATEQHLGGNSAPDSTEKLNIMTAQEKAALHTHDIPVLSEQPADAPAARIRLTSSSGFYVRSFAHDLGIACDSYATMAELTRVRQSGYTVKDPPPDGQVPCLTYEDLESGEQVWGPKLSNVLDQWMQDHPVEDTSARVDDRDRHYNAKRNKNQRDHRRRDAYGSAGNRDRADSGPKRQRRNSSSPDI